LLLFLFHQWTVKIVAYYVKLSGTPNKKCADVRNNIRRKKERNVIVQDEPGSLP